MQDSEVVSEVLPEPSEMFTLAQGEEIIRKSKAKFADVIMEAISQAIDSWDNLRVSEIQLSASGIHIVTVNGEFCEKFDKPANLHWLFDKISSRDDAYGIGHKYDAICQDHRWMNNSIAPNDPQMPEIISKYIA